MHKHLTQVNQKFPLFSHAGNSQVIGSHWGKCPSKWPTASS